MGNYHLKTKKTKNPKLEAPRLGWNYSDKYIIFTVYKAIHVGRLWEFHRFDLRLKEQDSNEEKEIITEFSLRDIDEHGESYNTLVVTLILGAIVSFVISLITVLLLGRS